MKSEEIDGMRENRNSSTIPSRAPKVSIGLPVFNGENYLAETLESLIKQSFRDFEIMISDNASTDRTQEICEAFCRKDDRIRYSRLSENQG